MAQQYTRTRSQQQRGGQQRMAQPAPDASRQQLAVIQPPRLAAPPAVYEEQKITEAQWRTLVDAIFPSAKTVEGVLLALNYCRSRGLDPFKRVVHVVPMWNGALRREVETVWPGIGELRTTAFRTGKFAGMDPPEYGPDMQDTFEGRIKSKDERGQEKWEDESVSVIFPQWCQITVYRMVEGVRCAFPGPRLDWIETYSAKKFTRIPNEKWQSSPRYMLEKCAEAAALRRAFPEELGGLNAAEEMEGKVIDGGRIVSSRAEPPPPRPTRQAFQSQAADPGPPNMDKEFDRAMGDRVVLDDDDGQDGDGEPVDASAGDFVLYNANGQERARFKSAKGFLNALAGEIRSVENKAALWLAHAPTTIAEVLALHDEDLNKQVNEIYAAANPQS